MFGKDKSKIEQNVTPEELSKSIDKSVADKEIEHFHVKADSMEIAKYKRRRKKIGLAMGIITAVLILLFIISMLVTQWGDLIISVDSVAVKRGIVLSEDKSFEHYGASLSANQQADVTNITYSWLPTDLDTSKDGAHNGDNYVAYTFYCKNVGQETLDYTATLDIIGVAKSADEAIRIMVYKNGTPMIYGKAKYDDRNTAETDCTMFLENDKENGNNAVMSTQTKGFKVDDVDKYTIVIWAEGNDAECIDDIRGGHVRARMLFQVEEDMDATKPFGKW